MAKPIKDITGKQFGMLTVISLNKIENKKTYWNCLCECGKETIISKANLYNAKSCGCYKRKLHYVHGDKNTKLLYIYQGLKQRCNNPNNKEYRNYGGRGIKVCDEWLNDYLSFKKWSYENGYVEGLTLDRIDNNGNYEPSNCRWVTRLIQAQNTRKNVFLECDGEIHCKSEWARILGIKREKFRDMLKRSDVINGKKFKVV